MPYNLLADLVLLLHLAFILFVVLGGLLALWRRGFALLHVPMFLWGAVVNLASWPCPLTPLEVHLRQLAGEGGYETGFVEHYIAPLVYPQGLDAEMGVVVGSATLVWNMLVYALVLYRRCPRSGR